MEDAVWRVVRNRWHSVLTTDTSAISDADGTQGIVSGGGNFTGAARPMAIRVYQVVARHRVFVVVVDVVTRLRILQRERTVRRFCSIRPAVLQQTSIISVEPTQFSFNKVLHACTIFPKI